MQQHRDGRAQKPDVSLPNADDKHDFGDKEAEAEILVNGVSSALQIRYQRKSDEGEEKGDDGNDATGVSDDGQLNIVVGEIDEDGVEVHEDGKVSEMVASAFGMRLVGGNEAASRRGPISRGRRCGVIPVNATNCKKEKKIRRRD